MPKGKPIIDKERCKGCELCNGACPQNILTMSKDFNKQGVSYSVCIDEEKCTACTMCAIMCPDCVIDIYRQEKK